MSLRRSCRIAGLSTARDDRKFNTLQDIETHINSPNAFKNYLEYSQHILDIFNGGVVIPITHKCSTLVHLQGYYYQFVEKNYDLAIKYYKLAKEHGYAKINITPQNIINKYIRWSIGAIVNLNDKDLHILLNRIKDAEIKQCNICLEENKKCIQFECTHDSCINCHLRILDTTSKCPFCRVHLNS